MGLFTTVDLYKIIDFRPSEFLEFIKPRLQEYINYLRTTKTKADKPFDIFDRRLGVRVSYSHDVKIRKRGRMVFGGIRVDILPEGNIVDIIVNDMFVNIVGKICIDLSKDLCRFYKWERDGKGEFNIGPLDCNKIRDVLHYDTPEDLR